MCTGRIDPAIIAKAFKKGLDGLIVVGCFIGECHYVSGNIQAKAKIDMTRSLLKHIGLNENRLSFQHCSSGEATRFVESSGEATRFVEIVNKFDKTIHELGPIGGESDQVKGPELFRKLEAAEAVLAGQKMRWVIGKKTEFLEKGNLYGEVFTEHEFKRTIDMIIVEETEVQEILGRLKEGAQSVKALAESLAMPSERVFRYINALRRKDMVELETISGQSPLYKVIPQGV